MSECIGVEKIQMERFKRDKETKEEFLVPFFIYKSDILCLYRDRGGSFVITKQGYMNKVPYSLNVLKEYLEL